MSFILLDKIGLQCNISKRKESGSFCEIKAKKKKTFAVFKDRVHPKKWTPATYCIQCSHPGSPRIEEAADLLMNQFHAVEVRNIFWAFYVQFGQAICL